MDARIAGLIPFPIMLGILVYFMISFYPETSRLPKSLIFNPPFPYSSVHTFFMFFSTMVVAYFFGRGFVSSGAVNLITLGSSSLILGLGFMAGSILGNHPFGGPEQINTISVTALFTAGILFGIFATLSLLNMTPSLRKRKMVLTISYLGSIMLILLIILIGESKFASTFYIPGTGPTPLREGMVTATALLFIYSSIIMMKNYSTSRISIIVWFSLGLASIAIGFVSAILDAFPGGPFSWLARITIAFGGVYFLIAVVTTYKKTRAERRTMDVSHTSNEDTNPLGVDAPAYVKGDQTDEEASRSGTPSSGHFEPGHARQTPRLMPANRPMERLRSDSGGCA